MEGAALAREVVAVDEGVGRSCLVALGNDTIEVVLKLDLLGDGVSKLERRGVEGREEGGDGNRDSPRLMVLSAIPEALVSSDAAEMCLGPFGCRFCCDIPSRAKEAARVGRISCMLSTNVKSRVGGPHAPDLCWRAARINGGTREQN